MALTADLVHLYTKLVMFVMESNGIEGIRRPPTPAEVEAHVYILCQQVITVEALNKFQEIVAPGMPLRTAVGLNVRVGAHIAPPGGPEIEIALHEVVKLANDKGDPFEVHCLFEDLHPYLDGNGRTGRALWLWQMYGQNRGPFDRPFLHAWYYQTLSRSQLRVSHG